MSVYESDSWRAGYATIDGSDRIIRSRDSLPAAKLREHWSGLVVVRWRFAPSTVGMPTPEQNSAAAAFEEAVDSALEAAGHGVLVAILTGGGHKEWRFYTRDSDAFMQTFDQAREPFPSPPIELTGFFDDEWSALAELLG